MSGDNFAASGRLLHTATRASRGQDVLLEREGRRERKSERNNGREGERGGVRRRERGEREGVRGTIAERERGGRREREIWQETVRERK